MLRGKRIKLYFVAQTQTRPPRFEFQTNADKSLPQHYERFLVNRLRRAFSLYGTPILMGYKRKSARRAGDGSERPRNTTKPQEDNESGL